MSQVWVVGEVLIDLIPDGSDRKPIVGGGPANTAKALSKLGIDTQFIDGVSTDEYGQMAKGELVSAGVKLDYIKYSDKPTCLAIVSLSDSGSASYEFVIENTATFDFTPDWLPNPQTERPVLLHIGTLATVIEPGASILLEWTQSVAKVAPIVFDPNVRPSIEGDKDKYRKSVERWIDVASIVKLSEEDLAWLYGDESVVKSWFDRGVSLVVVTRGDKGSSAIGSDFRVDVPAVSVEVVDTVGAGDTIGAVLVEGLVEYGLAGLSGDNLFLVLERAAKAASITCSRAGANPPTRDELENS